MAKFCIVAVAVLMLLAVSSCKSSNPGSREYIPGKGWVPN